MGEILPRSLHWIDIPYRERSCCDQQCGGWWASPKGPPLALLSDVNNFIGIERTGDSNRNFDIGENAQQI